MVIDLLDATLGHLNDIPDRPIECSQVEERQANYDDLMVEMPRWPLRYSGTSRMRQMIGSSESETHGRFPVSQIRPARIDITGAHQD